MEGNIFYEKFLSRRTKDLEAMLRNESLYQPAAIEAAKQIIFERNGEEVPNPGKKKESATKINNSKTSEPPIKTQFFKTLSWREFYSAFAISFLLLAINELLTYYHDEDWLKNKWYSEALLYVFLVVPILHVFYRKEHKKSNDFLGRCIHIFIFLLIYFMLRILRDWFFYDHFQLPFSTNEGLILLILIPLLMGVVTLMLEIPYTIIREVIKLFKWRVW